MVFRPPSPYFVCLKQWNTFNKWNLRRGPNRKHIKRAPAVEEGCLRIPVYPAPLLIPHVFLPFFALFFIVVQVRLSPFFPPPFSPTQPTPTSFLNGPICSFLEERKPQLWHLQDRSRNWSCSRHKLQGQGQCHRRVSLTAVFCRAAVLIFPAAWAWQPFYISTNFLAARSLACSYMVWEANSWGSLSFRPLVFSYLWQLSDP